MNTVQKLSDGRELQYADNGIESTSAIILHHGTTISNEYWNGWLNEAAAHGVRVIAPNRPGVDQSTRLPGRRVINDVIDTHELISALGIIKFVSIGHSGGGARALGTSILNECISVHTLAGISRLDEGFPESKIGFTKTQILRTMKLRDSYEATLNFRNETYNQGSKISYEIMRSEISKMLNFKKFESDYNLFSKELHASIINGLKNGVEIDTDDYFANINDWGFQIDDVKVPVTLWHGKLDDNVVFKRGQYMKNRLLNAKFNLLEDQDHISLVIEYRTQILNEAIADMKSIS